MLNNRVGNRGKIASERTGSRLARKNADFLIMRNALTFSRLYHNAF